MLSRKSVRATLLAACLTFSIHAVSIAETEPSRVTPSREELARTLIRLTGGGELGKQVMAQLVDAFRAANPALPDQFWSEFMASVDAKELEDLVVPVYIANLTEDEMQAAIAFYSSPAGQAMVKKLPVIMRDSMAAGQEWGRHLGEQVYERITKYKQSHPDA